MLGKTNDTGAGNVRKSVQMVALAGLVVLTACDQREPILPGERLGIRSLTEAEETSAAAAGDQIIRPVKLPATVVNSDWAQGPGSPRYRTDHPALGSDLKLAWSTSIGRGDGRRTRITASPVVAEGRIYTLDGGATVMATSTAGEPLWSRDLTPERDGEKDADGGGLAFDGGRIYVSSGFGHLTALQASSGEVLWTQKLRATGTGTPTVYDGVVYLVAGDTTAWAIEADTGRVRWQIDGLADANNISGGAAPALTDQRAVFAFGTGELQATFRQGGLRIWTSALVGQRAGSALGTIDDVTGDPMFVGDRVYAANGSGRTAAMSLGGGDQIWAAPHGAMGPLWVAGNSVFQVSDESRLMRLDADTGAVIWSRDLPVFEKPNRVRSRSSRFAHHGPVLAGGRLILASSDGLIRAFDPADGAPLGAIDLPHGSTSAPVVAGQTLYVVSTRGVLHAFR